MEKLRQLIRYAEAQGDLSKISETSDEITYSVDGRNFKLTCCDRGILDENGLWHFLKRKYPIIEVIELIRAAIESDVVRDESSDRKLSSFGYDYLELCSSKDVFIFCVDTSDKLEVYKIVFSRECQDTENGIEYAHRASLFIDTLVKRIMNKYSVLYADAACNAVPSIRAELPLHETVKQIGTVEMLDGVSSSEPIAKVRVLIRYRDTVGNSTFVENIIDDIFLFVAADGTVEWSFPKLHFGVRGYSENECRTVSVEERKKIDRLRREIESPKGKRAMFSALRRQSESALYEVIEKRKGEYAKTETPPKIEYSVTPLAMYISYPIQKTATYTLAFSERFLTENSKRRGQETAYSIKVIDAEINQFWVERGGVKHYVSENNPLVLAYTRNFLREETEPIPACFDCVSQLSELNPEYYGDGEFKNVFFLNTELISRSTDEDIAYDMNVPFLRSDMKRCELNGKRYHVRDMLAVDVVLKDGKSIGTDVKRYIRRCPENGTAECSYCKKVYGGKKTEIGKYVSAHKIINVSGKHCCESCIGKKLSDGGQILVKARNVGGGAVYVKADLKSLEELRICNWSDELLYRNATNRCRCCGESVNINSLYPISGGGLCYHCLGAEEFGVVMTPAVNVPDSLWRGVKRSLKFRDMRRSQCDIAEKGGYVWVYSEYTRNGDKYHNTYCFVKQGKGGKDFYYLKNCITLRHSGKTYVLGVRRRDY